MISLFKNKKTKKSETNTEIENIKLIAIPDIREYMIQGYKEIEQVKQEKEKMEKSRDNYKQDNKDNKDEINKLQEKIIVLDNEIRKAKNTIKEEAKVELVELIKKEKGNLSKNRVIEIIKSI